MLFTEDGLRLVHFSERASFRGLSVGRGFVTDAIFASALLMVFFVHSKDPLGPGHLLLEARVIDLVTVKLFHLCLRDEAPLEAEALFGEVLAAIVSDLLLGDAFTLLEPVAHDFVLDLLSI